MTAQDVVRLGLLTDIINKMSDDEKREYVRLVSNKDHKEIMDALSRQHALIIDIAKRVERQNWYVDFGSDLLANLTTDTLIWIFRRLFKK